MRCLKEIMSQLWWLINLMLYAKDTEGELWIAQTQHLFTGWQKPSQTLCKCHNDTHINKHKCNVSKVPSCISAKGLRQAPRGAWMNSRQEKNKKISIQWESLENNSWGTEPEEGRHGDNIDRSKDEQHSSGKREQTVTLLRAFLQTEDIIAIFYGQ